MIIKNAIQHFIGFHQGTVNTILHVIGFAGIFYSIYKLDWTLFAIFLVILELGHVYNHFAGIKPYDFHPRVTFWRVTTFILLVAAFYLLVHYAI